MSTITMPTAVTANKPVTNPIDYILDRTTMYRLVLYVLLGMLGVAAALAALGLLPFSPIALIASTGFLWVACWAANTVFAYILHVPTNVESATITALILALILDPASSAADFQFLGWAAILAMGSKYVLALNNRHFFNPAAIAAVITALALGEPASWWVGTRVMLPVALVGGLLIARKMRDEAMIAGFLVATLSAVAAFSLLAGLDVGRALLFVLLDSPLFFFAGVMLTEPLTAPDTKPWKLCYALLVGALFAPQFHIGPVYFTPELALVLGNVFAYLASSNERVILQLKSKQRVAHDIVDFVFASSQRLAFRPGQYIEVTLRHAPADARGNRRYFTLASSPTEAAVRLGVRFYPEGSTFKHALYALDGRTPMLGGQIAGDFTLPRNPSKKLLFIAGGIGITPYRSMLKYLLDTGQARDITVLYAARTPDEIIYRDVLNAAQAKLGIRTICALTDLAAVPRDWAGLIGRVDAAMIRAAVPDLAQRACYISGPPEMVRASEQALRSLGVQRRRIKKDFFPGLV